VNKTHTPMSAGADLFSPAVQRVFLSLSDPHMSLSHSALGLTVALLDSILQRVLLLLLRQRRATADDDDVCAARVLQSLVLPIDAARIQVAATNSAASAGVLDFSAHLVGERIRGLVADEATDALPRHGAAPSACDVSERALRRLAALLHVETERLLGDAIHLMRRQGQQAELKPQHVQVACELEPTATLLRVVAAPVSDTLDDFRDNTRSTVAAAAAAADDDDDDSLLASVVVTHDTASVRSDSDDAPIDVQNLLQTAGISRDHWSSNASQASSSLAGALAPVPSPASASASAWRFLWQEPFGLKHMLAIVIADVLLAFLLQR
jgi:hypothetical protein